MNVIMYNILRVYTLAEEWPKKLRDFSVRSRGINECSFYRFVLSLRIYWPANWTV